MNSWKASVGQVTFGLAFLVPRCPVHLGSYYSFLGLVLISRSWVWYTQAATNLFL